MLDQVARRYGSRAAALHALLVGVTHVVEKERTERARHRAQIEHDRLQRTHRQTESQQTIEQLKALVRIRDTECEELRLKLKSLHTGHLVGGDIDV